MTVDTFIAAIASLSLVWLIPLAMVLLGTLIYAVYNDEFSPPTFGAAGCIIALHFWSDVPLIEFFTNNYNLILKYTAYYFGIGVLWSLVKWYFFLVNSKCTYKAQKTAFLSKISKQGAHIAEAAKEGRIHSECIKDWIAEVNRNRLIPKASDHKSRIATWMMYWALSMIGTLVGDWLQKLWEAIYKLFGSVYDRMTKMVYGNEYFGEK